MDLSQSIQKYPLSQIQGKIEFHRVNFIYPSDPEQRLILNNINLTFEPREKNCFSWGVWMWKNNNNKFN